MASPTEYRQALWSILHDGVEPPKKTPQPTKNGARKALPPARRGMTAGDKVELAKFMKQIDAIKAKQTSPAAAPGES